jgi:hypothetical protein
MPLPDDVVRWVSRHFSAGDVESALATLGSAVDNTGELVSPRLVADPDGNLFRVFYDFATPERERARATAP